MTSFPLDKLASAEIIFKIETYATGVKKVNKQDALGVER